MTDRAERPPAGTEFEVEQRVLSAISARWVNHRDGYPRNVGNLAAKAGTTSSEFSRVRSKLRKEGRA